MSFRTTVILVVILAALLGAYMLLPSAPKSTPIGGTAPAEPTSLYPETLREADLARLEVQRPNEPALVFVRQAAESERDAWRMVAPVDVPTEGWRVAGLARAAAELESQTQLGADRLSAADAGLEPPRAVLKLTTTAGATYELEIGDQAPLSEDTYVRLAGQDGIHVVSQRFASLLPEDLTAYRAKNVLAFERGDVQSLTITVGPSVYVLKKDVKDQWSLTSPVQALADAEAVRDLIGRFAQLKAQAFVEPPAGGGGLESPYLVAEIEVVGQAATPAGDPNDPDAEAMSLDIVREVLKLEVGAAADLNAARRFARVVDQPGVFTLTTDAIESLTPDLTELRDNRIVRFDAADLDIIALDVGGQRGLLEFVQGEWIGRLKLDPINSPRATELVQTVVDLRAIDFIDEPSALSNYGLAVPRATIELHSRVKSDRLTLLIGDKTASGRNAWAQILDEPTVYVIGGAQADLLAAPPITLRSPQIFDFDPARLQTLSVTRDGETLSLARQEGQWAFVEPAGLPVDRGGVATLVNDLAGLRGRRVVAADAEPNSAPYLFDAAALRIELGTRSGRDDDPNHAGLEQTTLVVGQAGDAYYCRKTGEDVEYELDESVYEVLSGELIDRRLWSLLPGDIVGFALDGPGGGFELRKVDEAWTYPADEYVEIDPARMRALTERLADLEVDAYIAYRGADLAALGLGDAPLTLTITEADGATRTLKIEAQQIGSLSRRSAWVEQGCAFRLMYDQVAELTQPLEHYLKPGG